MTDWTPVSPGDPSWTPADVENSNTQAAQSAAEAAASATEAADSASAAADSATSATSSATTASDAATSILNSNVLVFGDGTTPAPGDFPAYSNGAWTALASTGSGDVVRAASPAFTGTLTGPDTTAWSSTGFNNASALKFSIAGTQVVTINANGIGIGVTPTYPLDIYSSSSILATFTGSGNSNKYITFDNTAGYYTWFLYSDGGEQKWVVGKSDVNDYYIRNLVASVNPLYAHADGSLEFNTASGKYTGFNGLIKMTGLPTADPGVSGALWNNSGTLAISAG